MGKQKLGESDSDDSDDDDDHEGDEEKEGERSIVLNNDNHSDSSKDGHGSSGSVTGGKQDVEFSGGSSSESGSEEEEKESSIKGNKESSGIPIVDSLPDERNDASQPVSHDKKIAEVTSVLCSELTVASETEPVEDEKSNGSDPVVKNVSTSNSRDGVESTLLASESRPIDSDPGVRKEAGSSINVAGTETPLNFDQINSAAELEALGLERLKSELQACGLKCGGTLQERAARLFLLKSTPLEKLSKKLLAKK
ncbi:hypothetical protein PanWU01x14_217130 [Parasponia andersonii]|uniref:SDE2/SF3A3 SAP domain-containing protein n=1 Tax=Parasponia andersonii TaxID=3476 RepID=A0A2P5BRD3_PARAD|nr:hypothetical protein PanWU01x14_217130 [Parasponia andersonii]